jgi:hypothetical protein
MRTSSLLLLAGGFVFATGNAAGAASRAPGAVLPKGTYQLQRVEILDRHGFGQPMTALTMFIPAGWSASGGVIWDTANTAACGKNGTRFEWRAVSPDGASAIEILPQETWSGHNLPLPPMSSCPNVTTRNVKDYLHWYASRVRPGARILDYRDRTDLTASLKYLNRSDPGVSGELKSWVEAGEILIAYQLDGRDLREAVSLTVIFMLNRMSGVMPGEIREFLTVSQTPALAVRAPHGQLDFKLLETIRHSAKADPRWSAAMAEHQQKMSGIATKGAADRHAIRMETAREIAEINRQGYESRQASQDSSVKDFVQVIRGVETYVDKTSNERVELPNTHHHAWRMNDGTYILTNDSNFEPYRDLGLDGRILEVTK